MAVGDIDRLAQAHAQFFQSQLCLGVGFGLARVGIHQQIDTAGKVVDNHQLIHLQQQDVGWALSHAIRVGFFGGSELGLDMPHGVVAKISRQPTCEPGHARTQRDLETLLIVRNEFQRVTLNRLDHLIITQQLDASATRADDIARGQSDEGVATKTLPTDD